MAAIAVVVSAVVAARGLRPGPARRAGGEGPRRRAEGAGPDRPGGSEGPAAGTRSPDQGAAGAARGLQRGPAWPSLFSAGGPAGVAEVAPPGAGHRRRRAGGVLARLERRTRNRRRSCRPAVPAAAGARAARSLGSASTSRDHPRGERSGAARPGRVDDIVRTEGRGPEADHSDPPGHPGALPLPAAEALRRVCETTDITPAQIAGVATFYDQFRHRPVGEHIVRVCEGTACHVAGAVEVGDEIRRCLGMANGDDTDPTGLFTIERVACIGSCSLAPVVTIDDRIRGHVQPLSAGAVLRDFLEASHGDARARQWPACPRESEVAVRLRRRESDGPRRASRSASASGPAASRAARSSVQAAVEEAVWSLGGGATVKPVGCVGLCHREPLVEVVSQRPTARSTATCARQRSAGSSGSTSRRGGLVRRMRADLVDARARLLDDSAWLPLAERQVDAAPYMAQAGARRPRELRPGRSAPRSMNTWRAAACAGSRRA